LAGHDGVVLGLRHALLGGVVAGIVAGLVTAIVGSGRRARS
jgi:hypothetical protein